MKAMEAVISLHSGLVGEPGGRFLPGTLRDRKKRYVNGASVYGTSARGTWRAPLVGNVQATSDMSRKAWKWSISLLI